MEAPREYTSEFVINNLENEQREFLLTKDTRTEISEKCGVQILIRGRLLKLRSDGTLPPTDNNVRPLYLLIIGRSKQSLSAATQRIQELLKNRFNNTNEEEFAENDNDSFEEKITCGIDLFPTNFGMRTRILGENHQNVIFIKKETNAVISLRGKGSNYDDHNTHNEPLYIHVRYGTPGSKKKTRQLILNLLDTVQNDFVSLYGTFYNRPRKPEIIPIPTVRNQEPIRDKFIRAATPKRDEFIRAVTPKRDEFIRAATPKRDEFTRAITPKRDELVRATTPKRDSSVRSATPKRDATIENKAKNNVDKISVGLRLVPPEFNLKRRLYGQDLTNVKHIEKVTGALLLLQGKGYDKSETDEPPYLLVKYQKPDLKLKGRQLILNLIETVHNEFIEMYGKSTIVPEKPQLLPYNKSTDNKRPQPITSSPVRTDPDSAKRFKCANTPIRDFPCRGPSPPPAVIPPPPPVISRPSLPKNEKPFPIPSIVNSVVKPDPPPEPPVSAVIKPPMKPLLNLTIPSFHNNRLSLNPQTPSHEPIPDPYMTQTLAALDHNPMVEPQDLGTLNELDEQNIPVEKLESLVDTVLKVACSILKRPDKLKQTQPEYTDCKKNDVTVINDNPEYVLFEDRQNFDKLAQVFQIYGEPAKAKFREEYYSYLKMFIRLQKMRRFLNDVPSAESVLPPQSSATQPYDIGSSNHGSYSQPAYSSQPSTTQVVDSGSCTHTPPKKRSRWSPAVQSDPLHAASAAALENFRNDITVETPKIQDPLLSQLDSPETLATVINNLQILPEGYPFSTAVNFRFNVTFNVLDKGISGMVGHILRTIPCRLNFEEPYSFVSHDLRHDDIVLHMDKGYKTSELWPVRGKYKYRYYRRRIKVQFFLFDRNIDFPVWTIVNEDDTSTRDVVLGLDFVRRWITQIDYRDYTITLADQRMNSSCRVKFEVVNPFESSNAFNNQSNQNKPEDLNAVRERERGRGQINNGKINHNRCTGSNSIPGLGMAREKYGRGRGQGHGFISERQPINHPSEPNFLV